MSQSVSRALDGVAVGRVRRQLADSGTPASATCCAVPRCCGVIGKLAAAAGVRRAAARSAEARRSGEHGRSARHAARVRRVMSGSLDGGAASGRHALGPEVLPRLRPERSAVRRKSSLGFADSAHKALISQRNWSRAGACVRPVTPLCVAQRPQWCPRESNRPNGQLDILRYPDPRLHTVAKPVAAVDERIRQLVDDMLETHVRRRRRRPGRDPGRRARARDRDRHLGGARRAARADQPRARRQQRGDDRSATKAACRCPRSTTRCRATRASRVRALDRDGETREFEADGLLAVACSTRWTTCWARCSSTT